MNKEELKKKQADTIEKIRNSPVSKTMYITVVDVDKKEKFNIVRNNFSAGVVRDRQTCTMTLYTKPLTMLQIGKKYSVCTSTTSDPSAEDAFDLISLGNFRIAFRFIGATLVKNDPYPVFEGWSNKFNVRQLTPMREVL